MAESLAELLESCSLASRAIHLLTAEATRRATLLRLCCLEYQDALDRLEDLLESCQEDGLDEVQFPELRRPGARNIHGGHKTIDRVSACGPRDTGYTAKTRAGREVRQRCADTRQSCAVRVPGSVSSDDCDEISCVASEASSIAESLQQILKQARSIRGDETMRANTVRSTIEQTRLAKGTVKDGVTRPLTTVRGEPTSVRVKRVPQNTSFGRGGVKIASSKTSYPAASTSCRRSARGVTNSGDTWRSECDSLQLKGRRHSGETIAVSNPASGRGKETLQARHRQNLLVDGQRTAPESEGTAGFVKGKRAGTAMLDIPEILWKEIARYDSAKTRLLGLYSYRDDKGKNPRHGLSDGELALLGALNSEASSDTASKGNRHLTPGTLPYPPYIAWLELLHPSAREEKSSTESTHFPANHRGAASGLRRMNNCGNHSTGERKRTQQKADEWDKVVRLQRSLVMLLDEVEGRRQLAAHEGQRNGRKDAATGIPVKESNRAGGDRLKGSSGGAIAFLPEFEDWYCSNKVAHVSKLLRERVDEMQGRRSLEQESISNAAAALIENPRRVLLGENPLCSKINRHHGPKAWCRLGGARRLEKTACFVLMQELRVQNAPCFPLECCWQKRRNTTRGVQDAEVFAQELRDEAVLAAETDVSRIVLPVLARALSDARLQEWPSHIQTYNSKLGKVQTESKAEKVNCKDLEKLRERVQRQTSWAEHEAGCRRKHEATGVERMTWAPRLAVFRAVDAVLGGEGRPRITFMRPEAGWVASELREYVP